MIEDRVISPELIYEDDNFDEKIDETTLRPQTFSRSRKSKRKFKGIYRSSKG